TGLKQHEVGFREEEERNGELVAFFVLDDDALDMELLRLVALIDEPTSQRTTIGLREVFLVSDDLRNQIAIELGKIVNQPIVDEDSSAAAIDDDVAISEVDDLALDGLPAA